jgi:sugar/nucleoside kinase (ribokinase family)
MTVITVGVHIVDVLARPVESIPAGQETALVEQIRLTAAGSAAGTAVDLARLGLDVISMGAVGDDELGDFLIAAMTRHGVDVTRLARRTTDQTAASILPIRPDGGRPSFHVPGANLTVTTADVDLALLKTANAVHLGGPDVTFGLNDPAFFAALDEARSGGTLVTMDLLSEMEDLVQGALAFLPHVDYFLPNKRQLFLATGIPETKQAAHWLLGENEGLRGVLATLGGEGSLVVTDSGGLEVAALPVEVVDTTGCGDAYCAGFIAGLVEGVGVETAARWGTAAAAAVATGLGSDAGDLSLDRLVTQI